MPFAAQSTVFESMMSEDNTDSIAIHVENVRLDSVEKFVKFIYYGKIEKFDDSAQDLLALAVKFDVKDLVVSCLFCQFFTKNPF
jgi:hypothetical protein